MNFGNDRESKNFLDLTGLPKMLSMLFETQGREEARINNTFREGAPGGYNKWITSELNHLTPEEYQAMKENGLNLGDIWMLRQFQSRRVPIDKSVPIYDR